MRAMCGPMASTSDRGSFSISDIPGMRRGAPSQPTPGQQLQNYKRGSVLQRKAYDVGVVGGGLVALAAALQLARVGRKVVVIEEYGVAPAAQRALWQPKLLPLTLVHQDPHLAFLSSLSLPAWREVEAAAGGVPLLAQPGSLHFTSSKRDPGGDEIDQLRESCREAGVAHATLNHEEVAASLPMLRLRPGVPALRQPEGGALAGRDALGALRALATRAGADVRPMSLLGWKDAGSHFAVRYADAAMSREGDECVAECGQLLLAPDAWPAPSLATFGLRLEGLSVRRVVGGTWAAPSSFGALPLCVCMDANNWVSDEEPRQGRLVALPLRGGGGLMASQHVGDGAVAEWRDEQQQQGDGASGDAGEGDERVVAVLGATLQQFLPRLGPSAQSPPSSYLATESVDGAPVLGSHPGYEDGRVVVAVAGSSGSGRTLAGEHLAPLLAAGVLDVADGRAPRDLDAARAALLREAMGAEVEEGDEDTWHLHVERASAAARRAAEARALDFERRMDEGSRGKESLWLSRRMLGEVEG